MEHDLRLNILPRWVFLELVQIDVIECEKEYEKETKQEGKKIAKQKQICIDWAACVSRCYFQFACTFFLFLF